MLLFRGNSWNVFTLIYGKWNFGGEDENETQMSYDEFVLFVKQGQLCREKHAHCSKMVLYSC